MNCPRCDKDNCNCFTSGEFWELQRKLRAAESRVRVLVSALTIAEAALADIGDATREKGDGLSWCEARASKELPEIRMVLRNLNEN